MILNNRSNYNIAMNLWFIVSKFKEKAKIIRTAREINNYKTEWVIEKIKNIAHEFELKEGRKPVIACFGLTFKPEIDDLRENPALYVVQSLLAQGYEVLPVEPNVDTESNGLGLGLETIEEALKQMDLGFKLVGYTAFRELPKDIVQFVKG